MVLRQASLITAILVFGAVTFAATPATAETWYRPFTEESQPDVFYNYYVPGDGAGVPAAMYPAPVPNPPLVGHTYYTYQPLMPHEFLYHHRRTYHQYYNGGMGMNRTSVRWFSPPVRTAFKGLMHSLRIPR